MSVYSIKDIMTFLIHYCLLSRPHDAREASIGCKDGYMSIVGTDLSRPSGIPIAKQGCDKSVPTIDIPVFIYKTTYAITPCRY